MKLKMSARQRIMLYSVRFMPVDVQFVERAGELGGGGSHVRVGLFARAPHGDEAGLACCHYQLSLDNNYTTFFKQPINIGLTRTNSPLRSWYINMEM